MKSNADIMLVDDEKSVLITLQKFIKRAFPTLKLVTADDGLEAWNFLKESKVPIVISDLRMPKLDGIQLCSRIRANEELKNIYFILVTAISDPEKKIHALELGADDYINKPIQIEEIIARIKSALRIIKLQNEIAGRNNLVIDISNNLKSEISSNKLLALKFQQIRYPAFGEMIKRIAKATKWIAIQLGINSDEDLENLEIASYYSQCGKMFLPDDMIRMPVIKDGQATHNLVYQIPVVAKEILSHSERFSEADTILYHLYENFDGSGFPDRLKTWQIPMLTRILRVAYDYEEIKELANKSPKETLHIIFNSSKRLYDHRVVILLSQYIKSIAMEDYDPNERAVKLQELREGMILAQDILTVNGLLLLPAGAILKVDAIQKIYSHSISDPILGSIYVRKHSKPPNQIETN